MDRGWPLVENFLVVAEKLLVVERTLEEKTLAVRLRRAVRQDSPLRRVWGLCGLSARSRYWQKMVAMDSRRRHAFQRVDFGGGMILMPLRSANGQMSGRACARP